MVVARAYRNVVALGKIAYLEQRLPHLYAQCLGLVAARHDAAVVVAQHNNGHAVERGIEDPLARNEEIVAVTKSNHGSVACVVQWNGAFIPS